MDKEPHSAARLLVVGLLVAYIFVGLLKAGYLEFIRQVLLDLNYGEYLGLSRKRIQWFFKVDDSRIRDILDNMDASLHESYSPTVWAHDAYVQIFTLWAWRMVRKMWPSGTLEQIVLDCSDGGQVAIEEYVPYGCCSEDLPKNAMILVILHSIGGKSYQSLEIAEYAYSQKIRPMILVRRGHFGPLKVPKFNVMGCVSDTKLMLRYIRRMYPSSFIGALGLSAGSGQLMLTLGQQNQDHLIDAAVLGCPAYDLKNAMQNFCERSPILQNLLLRSIKNFFLHPSYNLLKDHESFDSLIRSSSVHEFLERAFPLAGFKSYEDFLQECNPMNFREKNYVPTLVINAADDPVCVKENIPFDLMGDTENYALVFTESGSHVAYREGWLAQQSWSDRLAVEFLLSAFKKQKGGS